MRFSCGSCCVFAILLTSSLLEMRLSIYEDGGQPGCGCPGSLAEVNQQGHVIEADLEGGGHGAEAGRIGRYMTGFDRRHSEDSIPDNCAASSTDRPIVREVLDHAAEEAAPGAAGERGWGVRH